MIDRSNWTKDQVVIMNCIRDGLAVSKEKGGRLAENAAHDLA